MRVASSECHLRHGPGGEEEPDGAASPAGTSMAELALRGGAAEVPSSQGLPRHGGAAELAPRGGAARAALVLRHRDRGWRPRAPPPGTVPRAPPGMWGEWGRCRIRVPSRPPQHGGWERSWGGHRLQAGEGGGFAPRRGGRTRHA
jgi:hypothetical protein